MGNSAWGAGYHQGHSEGLGAGRGQGREEGAVVTAAASLLLAGGLWGFQKIRKRRAAKEEQRFLVEHRLEDRIALPEPTEPTEPNGSTDPGRDETPPESHER